MDKYHVDTVKKKQNNYLGIQSSMFKEVFLIFI